LLYSAPKPANLDRRVLKDLAPSESSGKPLRMSDLALRKGLVLLGEPGSGKSTAFALAAAAQGTTVVTAKAFVSKGIRPEGKVAFIDAVEEYRIGETGRDRLEDLIEALKDSQYDHWRITCRSISLPRPDLLHIVKGLGDFETFHLGQLDQDEQKAILASLGERDPDRILQRVNDLAAGSLMENAATLKLLHQTLGSATNAIESRGALFAHATRAMADEMNAELPERATRSTSGAIVEAAEKACLVLMLSAREDIWMGNTAAPRDNLVVRDDLIPAGVDTQALRDAIDTPMFRGEAGVYSPTHRMVAEYLAGRALSAATSSRDGRPPALPFQRAYALLCGDDNKPAPALLGTFAWFVTELAQGVHHARALRLVKAHPEAILFQGDAAMLPTRHREALLAATGRADPWFLSSIQGATAVGGLAGTDLEIQLRTILNDKSETAHRRNLVIEALTSGRRVPGLDDDLIKFTTDQASPGWLRRHAIEAIKARIDKPLPVLRKILTAMKGEPAATAMVVAPIVMAALVGHGVTAAEVRKLLADYSTTGDGVMGYLWPLGDALEKRPIVNLFEKPIGVKKNGGHSRSFESASIIQRVLAKTIEHTPNLKAEDLLRWMANGRVKESDDTEDQVRVAVRGWVARGPSNSSSLFWALFARSHGQGWRPNYDYYRIVGAEPPAHVFDEAFDKLEKEPAGPSANALARIVFDLVGPWSPDSDNYWRFWHLTAARTDLQPFHLSLSVSDVSDWRADQAARVRKTAAAEAEEVAKDKAWFETNLAKVQAGLAFQAMHFAANVYGGYNRTRPKGFGMDQLTRWVGSSTASAIVQGWSIFMTRFPITWQRQAAQEGKNLNFEANTIAAIWLDLQLSRGAPVNLPLDAAFGALRGYYVLQGDNRDKVQTAALEQLLNNPVGENTLLAYWKAAIKGGSRDLPFLEALRTEKRFGPVAAFLRSEPNAQPEILRSALAAAGTGLQREEVAALVDAALRRKKITQEALSLWRLVAFLINPVAHEPTFAAELASGNIDALFDRLNRGHLIRSFEGMTKSAATRDTAIARLIGPLYKPTDNDLGNRDDMSQVVAGALKRLAQSPTVEATGALESLLEMPALSAWYELLSHHLSNQILLRQQAQFTAPTPRAVAEAINAGPPATPSDLRAVVGEILQDLAKDIRDGDTSGWKGFWNNPDATSRRPKIENDCRDLLTDRIRDRLLRFGVGANRTPTEARRRSDRRADLLVIGEGSASLPVEAKRHMNDEVFTAIETQVADYAKSAGSNGHGIYLVFWFGAAAGAVPKRPPGVDPITDPKAFRTALVKHQPIALRDMIDVVVMDLSPQGAAAKPTLERTASRNGTAKAAAKRNGAIPDAVASQTPRPRRRAKEAKDKLRL
jgi:hypothetical protein